MSDLAVRRTPVVSTTIEFERSLGVMPLEEIEHELERTTDEWSTGAALYGPGGLYDDLRKTHLSVIAAKLRKSGEAKTEGGINEAAHADAQYVKFVQDSLRERERWLALDARRKGLYLRVARGDALLRVAGRGL